MKTIYKYKLKIADSQIIQLPKHCRILAPVQVQNDEIVFWAFVDTDNKLEDRLFFILGTGNPIPKDFHGVYLGSVQMVTHNTPFVWHVFMLLMINEYSAGKIISHGD